MATCNSERTILFFYVYYLKEQLNQDREGDRIPMTDSRRILIPLHEPRVASVDTIP